MKILRPLHSLPLSVSFSVRSHGLWLDCYMHWVWYWIKSISDLWMSYILHYNVALISVFRPPSLGSMPQENSKFSLFRPTNSIDKDVTMLKTLPAYNHDGTRPKHKTVTVLSPHQQPGLQPKKWWCYHIPLGTPVTHKLPHTWWTENEEVLCHLKDDIKPPHCNLVNAFLNNLNALPQQKKIKKLCAGIKAQSYLTTTFQWSQIVNKQLCDSKLLVQQYQELITAFEQQEHLYFNEMYQEGYTDVQNSKRFRKQYKPSPPF